jgi:hypothetical protein
MSRLVDLTTPGPLDPHEDFTRTADEVVPLLQRMISEASYIIRVGEPRACMTCLELHELRFGHCSSCARLHQKVGS